MAIALPWIPVNSMATAPVFVQDGSLGIFWLSGAPAVAYLPSAGSLFQGALTLEQAWADTKGLYLVLDQKPADIVATLPILRAFIDRLGFPGSLRMAWLTTIDRPPSAWMATTLQIIEQQIPAAITHLGQTAIVDFTPYSLVIGQNTEIALAGESSGWGFTLTPTTDSVFLWQGASTQQRLSGGIRIPFGGATPGCFCFQLAIPDFTEFGAAISFFYEETIATDPLPSGGDGPRIGTGYAHPLTLPILTGGLNGELSVTLDPTRPLDAARTAFAFPAGSEGISYPSCLASPHGHPIGLSALPASGEIPGSRFVFQKAPIYTAPDTSEYALHIVPDGVFVLHVTPPRSRQDGVSALANPPWIPVERLLCGISGVEYVGLPMADGCRIVFSAGNAAFAPGAAEGVPPTDNSLPLTKIGSGNGIATTSWVTVLPPAGRAGIIQYFSQPEQAPLYGTTSGGGTSKVSDQPPPAQDFLFFTELPSVQVGAGDTGRTYPLAPYRGLSPELIDVARRIEASGIAPARRLQLDTASLAQEDSAVGSSFRSVTPQGLVVDWDSTNPSVWTDIVIGNDVDPVSATANSLQLTSVGGPLRCALQTNRLFMIGANPVAFAKGGSVPYGPDADTFARLIADYPDTVYRQVADWYKTNDYPRSNDEVAFKDILASIPGVKVDPGHFETLRSVSGLLRAKISGWSFQFSPWSWIDNAIDPDMAHAPRTMMILKFAPGKLSDLAADPATWAWSAVASFGGSTNMVRDRLRSIIDDARDRQKTTPRKPTPYDHFLDQVVDNPNWSGVLVLGCPIPLTELPGPLQCLASGIDPTRFTIHHFGLDATAFQVGPTGIELSQTSMFGLIDYQDDEELHLDPTPDAGFAYKVQNLTIEFANSAIRGFSSRVALLAPHLFGSTLTLRDTTRGNTILMDGVFQKPANSKSDADGTYVFRIVDHSLYDAADSVISTIDIRTAEFSTVATANPSDPQAIIHAQFRLGGRLAFQTTPDFDILGYGPTGDEVDAVSALEFQNLLVDLSFPLYRPQTPPVFFEKTHKLTTDAKSIARSQSLINRFPVRLVGLIGKPAEGDQAPADLGYVPADTPLGNSRLNAPWWGILYEIDLGTGGALSGGSPLAMTVLAAWSKKGPRDETPPLYVGVRLPGLKDLIGASLPFESFLRLGFRNIQFSAYNTDDGNRAYLLRFRRFSISALGVSFPPGNIDAVLFGNPSGDKSKVGWYAAYAADEDKKKQRQTTPDRLRQAARRGAFGRS